MNTWALYIGADNDTGQINLERIKELVGKHHEGFTVIPGQGRWQGTDEPSAMVLITSDEYHPDAYETAALLKSELHQQAIGVQRLPAIQFA